MKKLNENARTIFLGAIEISSDDDRWDYVEKRCGGDAELRGDVAELLHHHRQIGHFLESPPAGACATIDQPLSEQPGTLIGPYKLLEQIGEGGMGLVYMAEQQRPMRRLVALKLIKPGMDSKQVIARFEAERQALAMMDHPNIAKVHDAGTTETGRPYFSMELVRGIPISDFCDHQKLTVHQRLELFIQVCQAVQHAHQKGIIHRDLKPTNVLVTNADTVPLPKVIDFGIAKALGPALTDHTLHTGFAQLVGTPMYMSPEQAQMNHFGVDTRSDVYSLGVLLYELLTGTTPFNKEILSKAGLDEMRRIIREDDPPRPSARMSTLNAQALSTISQQRNIDPRRISASLRGELDWIVMKALEKDRSRRYESASALAADIQLYLSDEPVLACPPTAMYRFQKFARKHKPALFTTAAIALCLLLGTTVSAWQAARATQAEAQATANANQAQEKAREATEQRDQAEKQRDEVKALANELRTTLYASTMNRAKTAWDQNSVDTVVSLLNDHRPKAGEADLRGFEWHYLHRLCNPNPPLVLNLRTYSLLSIKYSPNGKRLVSSTWGSWNSSSVNLPELKMWDTETGKELFKLNGSDFETVVFSPDGKRLASASATASDDKARHYETPEAKVWDSETGAELLALKGHTGFVVSLAYSPDGKRIASGSEGSSANPDEIGELKIWDAATGQELRSLSGNTRSVAFSPDGKRLACVMYASATDGPNSPPAVHVLDVETGKRLLHLPGGGRNVAYSPNGQLIAASNWNRDRASGTYSAGVVKVWNSQTGEEIRSLTDRSEGWIQFAFSPDSQRIATAGQRARVPRVKVSDTTTGDELFTFQQHTDRIQAVAFSPDSKHLATGAADQTLRIWDLKTGYEVRTLKGENPEALAFSPDGKRLASGTDGSRGGREGFSTVNIWNLEEASNPRDFQTAGNQGAISMDFKQFASATDGFPSTVANKAVTVWSADSGRATQSFKGYANMILCMAFSRDGQRLAVGDGGGPNAPPHSPVLAKIWDVKTGQEFLTLKGHAGLTINSLAFSPDGRRLATRCQGGGVRELKMWDAQTGEHLFTLDLMTPIGRTGYGTNVVFSPGGQRFATGSAPGVKIFRTQDGTELLSIVEGGRAVAFSAEGKRIATGSNTVFKVWDAETGKELLASRTKTRVNGLAFSPDGTRIASVSNDGTVSLWDAHSGHLTMTFDYTADRGTSLGELTKQHHSITFSADGHRLASVLWDGAVRIWDATPLPEKP